MNDLRLSSKRLILRLWRDADREPFTRLSADRRVMEHLMPLPSREAADAWIDRQRSHLEEHGFGVWAVELAETSEFIGAVGLLRVSYKAHFTPAVEVAWRLSQNHWGRGYAPEAAAVSLQFGFEKLRLPEIVANTVAGNLNSQKVMLKLGMSRSSMDDFEHPLIPEGHPLRRQVLYRISQKEWRALGVD
ncbi:MAG TPA: GNAT family N-acetyltransferase [Stellaceae bacterium]|nr:GNAT family N-acetyltransferase [Stellaceae bacterium]